MKTNFVIPLVALTVLAAATAAASRISFPAEAPIDGRIVDLPAITVRAAPQDAAYFRANRIVDLPRITVYPESTDLALFLATDSVRIVHVPASPPPALLDRRVAVATSFDALAVR
jgi:hypothetical protein